MFSQVATQNSFATLAGDDDDIEEEEERLEEEERRRESKRKNEEGARKSQEEERRKRTEEKEKELCKLFKFGGKCPHGMNGLRKHKQFDHCNRSHPKVCNKLLTHGTRGNNGCDGKDCEKFHPKMCYSSMNSKVCTKEKCTYWHCKGTSFSPQSSSRYEAPSRASLDQYPCLPDRRGRSPLRREREERLRLREEQHGRGEREERRKREEEQDMRRRREDRDREERGREERKKDDSAHFLGLAEMIRQEVQRAILTMLPPSGASGSVASHPRPQTVSPIPSWAEQLFSRNSSN